MRQGCTRSEIKINGVWLNTSEDCELVVAWRWEPDFYSDGSSKVQVDAVEEIYGIQTGKNYRTEVEVSSHLLDHLSDLISEMQEM